MSKEIRSRTRKQDNPYFTQVSNSILESMEISLKAKGLYSYMFSKPENWNFTIKSMAKQLKEGTTSISNALIELKDNGWVEYTKYADGTGEYFLLIEPKEVDNRLKDAVDGMNNTLEYIADQQPPKQPTEQKEKPKTKKQKDAEEIERFITYVIENTKKLYPSVDVELFTEYLKDKKGKKNQRAGGIILKKIKECVDGGHDVNSVIERAYEGNYQSLFVPKANNNTSSSQSQQINNASGEEQQLRKEYEYLGATEKQLLGLSAGLKLLENSPHKEECIHSYKEELNLEIYAMHFRNYAQKHGVERESITKTVSIMGQATYSINGVQDDKEHRYNMTVAKEFEQPYMYQYAPKKGSK